jgi:hypothetical protein
MRPTFVMICILAVFLALIIDLGSDLLALRVIETFLGFAFLFFLPGYCIEALLFSRSKMSKFEAALISIGLSISASIIVSMCTYFAGMKIEFATMMDALLLVTFILSAADIFLVKSVPSDRRSTREGGFNFYILLGIFAVVMCVSILFSINLPSREEYVEMYWSLSQVEGIRNVTQANCTIPPTFQKVASSICSLSGINEVGNVNLAGRRYGILIMDLEKAGYYDSFCIDLNNNMRYCDSGEGPFMYYETFFLGSSAFKSLYFNQTRFVFANYPRYVFDQNFTVSFVVNSHYSRRLNFNVSVFANQTILFSKAMELLPNKPVLLNVSMLLPKVGLFNVRANARPKGSEDEGATISFWADRQV